MKRFLAWPALVLVLLASTTFAPAGAASAQAPAAPAARAAAPGRQVTELTAGAAHTCALYDGKTLRCWGDNQYGELGNGSNAPTPQPGDVQGLSATPTVTLSRAVHNCSLMSDATVQCWGMNKYGQLGDGTLTNSKNPLTVKALTGPVRLLAVGGDHTCVVYQKDDSTWCWGQNKYGELGDGKLTPGSEKPVEVKGLPSPPVKFATGVWHTCAILKNGSTWCWGHNEEGELGVGTKHLGSPKPVQVKGLPSTPVQMEAGNFHTCAVENDGSTWCWGENKYGQLGTGTAKIVTKPQPVNGLPGIPTRIITGGYHTCATFADGTVWCWGQNNFGQVGDGTNKNASKPVQVKGLRPNPTLVVGGGLHTCAAYSDGAMSCWGLNATGQLGNASVKPVAMTPVPVGVTAKAPAAAPAAASSKDDSGGSSTAAEVTGVGLAVLAVAGFVAFLVTRRRRT